MTTFEPRNIVAHIVSTVIGVLLAVGLLILVVRKICSFADVSAPLLAVVPFLLYGRRPPGAPGFDSTAAPEQTPIGAPGVPG